MKKKFLAAILTAAMVLGLTACGGSADTAASSDAAAADTTETTETTERSWIRFYLNQKNERPCWKNMPGLMHFIE